MRVVRISAIATAAIVATLFVGWWQVDGPGADRTPGMLPLPLTAMEFSLSDQDGDDVGPESLIGQPSLIFFGFTYCPDICPTTLSDISGWLDEVGPKAANLNTVFITVDPDRDTIKAIAEYVSYFHPQIQGWTGSANQIAAAAGDFRVTYEKVQSGDGTYTMNHTAGIFLFDAAGRFVSTIDYHEPREFAVPKIERAIRGIAEGLDS